MLRMSILVGLRQGLDAPPILAPFSFVERVQKRLICLMVMGRVILIDQTS